MPRAGIAIAIMLAIVGGVAPAGAGRGGRTVSGTILVPTMRAPAAFEAPRCAWLTVGDASQGVLGLRIGLARKHEHRRFVLAGTGDALADTSVGQLRATGPRFAVAFYRAGGSCATPLSALSEHHADGATVTGFVPAGGRTAIVIRIAATAAGPVPIPGCYAFPPVCVGPNAIRAGLHASDEPVPEPFVFRILPAP